MSTTSLAHTTRPYDPYYTSGDWSQRRYDVLPAQDVQALMTQVTKQLYGSGTVNPVQREYVHKQGAQYAVHDGGCYMRVSKLEDYSPEVTSLQGSLGDTPFTLLLQSHRTHGQSGDKMSYCGAVFFGKYSDIAIKRGVEYVPEGAQEGIAFELPFQLPEAILTLIRIREMAATRETDSGKEWVTLEAPINLNS